MTNSVPQRGNCRFVAKEVDGRFLIEMQLFHQTVPLLANAIVQFELLPGTSGSDAKRLAEAMNERILGIVITPP